MTPDARSESNAPFGLSWGMPHTSVEARFVGLAASAGKTDQGACASLIYNLSAVAEVICAQGGFCPAAFFSSPERSGDEVEFSFNDDRLSAVIVRFGYPFSIIGQDPDNLSDQAMTTLSRAEMQRLIFELSAKYGPPSVFTETPKRSGMIHVQGSAQFLARDDSVIFVMFGHDGGSALVGELLYQPSIRASGGF